MSTDPSSTGLSIGALSQATGIAPETLRTWERRYGAPHPQRTDAGHRVYDPAIVGRLRLVQAAIAQGHRAKTLLKMSIPELERMISDDTTPACPSPPPNHDAPASPTSQIERWLDAARAFDGESLDRSLQHLWYTQGARRFLNLYAAPFIQRVGEAWAAGEISVQHEHFISERLRDFFTAQWRPLSERSQGPLVLCTTLPGEHHTLGLHMAALTIALCGCKLVFLGEDTPLEDIVGAIQTLNSLDSLLISCSICTDDANARQQLATLRARLPHTQRLIIGGQGAPPKLPNITRLTQLDELIPLFIKPFTRD